MKRNNYVILDSSLELYQGLSVPNITDNEFRNFTSDSNVIEVYAPIDDTLTFYGIAQSKSSLVASRIKDRHRGVFVRTESIDNILFNVWEFTPQSIVFSSPNAQRLEFQVEFQEFTDVNYLGSEYVPVAEGQDELAVTNAWLDQRYPEATSGDYVRVVSQQTDYVYNGLTWDKQAEYKDTYVTINKSTLFTWDIERGNDAGFPVHEPTTTELIYAELDARPTLLQLEASYYDKIESDARFINATGDDMSGTLGIQKIRYVAGGTLTDEGDIRYNPTTHSYELLVRDNVNPAERVIAEIPRTVLKTSRNTTGSSKANGLAVYINGAIGASPTTTFAVASNDDPSIAIRTIGLITASADNNADTEICVIGEVNDILRTQLSGVIQAVGEKVYLGLNGNLTTDEPTGTALKVCVGTITRLQQNTFSVEVSVNVFPTLEQLSGVEGTYTTNTVLEKQADGTWLPYNLNLKADVTYVDAEIVAHNIDLDAHANQFDLKADLVGGKVPAAQLPSYVDDVLEYATFADLPVTGESGKLYVVLADETSPSGDQSIYRWATSTYVRIYDELSAVDVKTLYESNANTNVFTDAEKTKLFDLYNKAQLDIFFNDIQTDLNDRYTKAEVDALLNQLKAIYGWEDSLLGSFDNADTPQPTFAYSLIEDYDFVLATWKELDATPIETYTVYFKPEDLIDGHCVRTQIQNQPVRTGCLSRSGTTITVGVVDNNNNLQASENATVTLTGVKLTPLDATKVSYNNATSGLSAVNVQEAIDEVEVRTNAYLNVDNQDAVRTDRFKLAIIDGKLAYKIEEGI